MARVLFLRGVMGTGKTTLQLIMRAGLRHLVRSDLIDCFFSSRYLPFHELWKAQTMAALPPEELVQAQLAQTELLIIEPGNFFAELYCALRIHHEVDHAYLAAPDFLVAARQRSRFLARGDATIESVHDHPAYQDLRARRVISLAEEMAKWPQGVPTTFIDASDFPYVEIPHARATELIDVIGPRACAHNSFTSNKADELGPTEGLPFPDLSNADVLVVGSDNAWMVHEAVSQQARSVFLVEVDAQKCAALRRQRDAAAMPVTLVNADIATSQLPPLHCYGQLRRFSVGFVAAPTTWGTHESDRFLRLLNACDSLVVLPEEPGPSPSRRAQSELPVLARDRGFAASAMPAGGILLRRGQT